MNMNIYGGKNNASNLILSFLFLLLFSVIGFAQRPEPIPLSIDLQMKGVRTANSQMGLVVKMADFNGDGKKDLLTNNILGNYVINLAKSDGSFDTTGFSLFFNTRFLGANTLTVGDFNNDGKDDLGIIASNSEGRTVLNIYNGNVSSTGISTTPSTQITLSNQSNFVSNDVQIVPISGDINGDGFDDVAIGSPNSPSSTGGDDDYGRLYFIYGSIQGLNPSTIKMFRHYEIGYAGSRVAIAGDINKDGFDDVIMTANRVIGYENRVFLMLGSAQGILPELSYFGKVTKVETGSREDDDYANNIGNAGDINGDGFDDIYISDPNRNTYVQYVGDPNYRGRLTIFNGDKTRPFEKGSAAWSRYPRESYAVFGSTVGSVGDFDDDGFDDIAIIDKRSISTGHRLLIYKGGQKGIDSLPSFQFSIKDPSQCTITKAGDINGDGYHDFFLGEPTFDNFLGSSGGRVALIKGRSAIVPDFEIKNNSACVGNSIQFFDKSFAAIPHTLLWDFGDGTTDTSRNPVHIYTELGNKTVTLTIIDNKGRKTIKEKKDFLIVRKSLTAGTYTLGEGGDIPNIKTLNDLLECGSTGKVTIQIKDGTYNGALKLQDIYFKDTLIIESLSKDATKVIIKDRDKSTLLLKNTGNIIFKNISIEGTNETPSGEYSTTRRFYIVEFSNSENIKFIDCNVVQASSLNSFNYNYYLHFIGIENMKNLRIENCTLNSNYRDISTFRGLNIKNSENIIIDSLRTYIGFPVIAIDSSNNLSFKRVIPFSVVAQNSQYLSFTNSNAHGWEFKNINFLELSNNRFTNPSSMYDRFGGGSMRAQLHMYKVTGLKVTKNIFKHPNLYWRIDTCSGLSENNWNLIVNNIMYANDGGAMDIYRSKNLKVYHNTINNGELEFSDNDSLDYRNNLLASNARQFFSIYSMKRYNADFNVYGVTVQNEQDSLSLSALKNTLLNKLGTDLHSLFTPITFQSDSITPSVSSAIFLKKAAPKLPEVNEDFNGKKREGELVDIGAIDLDVNVEPLQDISAIDIRTKQLALGRNDITINVVNTQNRDIDSLYFYYQINDSSIIKEKHTIKLKGLESLNYTFTTPFIVRKGRIFNLKIWVKLEDTPIQKFTLTNNDTLKLRYTVPMAGVYVIGGIDADYSNALFASQEINECSSSGDITLIFNPGNYSSDFFRTGGNGVIKHKVTLKNSGKDNSSVKLALRAINYSNIVIENLTLSVSNRNFQGGYSDTPKGIIVISNYTKSCATFRNCIFTSHSTGTGQYLVHLGGITISETFNVIVDSCRFKDNSSIQLVKSYNLLGATYTGTLDTVIVKNSIFEENSRGVYSESFGVTKLFEFSSNVFLKSSYNQTTRGVFIQRAGSELNCTVSNNLFSNASLNISIGLDSFGKGYIHNNIIRKGSILIGGVYDYSYNYPIDYSKLKWVIAHNTVPEGSIYVTPRSSSLIFNNFVAQYSGVHGYRYISTPPYRLNLIENNNFIDYNSYFDKESLTNGQTYSCYDLRNIKTLKELFECTGNNKNSLTDEDPRFISETDLHPDTTQYTPLSNSGMDITNFPELALDFTGRPRDLKRPDIGAYEVGGNNSQYVWAGDANNDGLVNNLDLFTIGVVTPQNLTGKSRSNASAEWTPQSAEDWSVKIAGKNAKYADCDGSGAINGLDVPPINRNYGKTHAALIGDGSNPISPRSSVDIPLYFSNLPDSASNQTEFEGYISLGDKDRPANNLYGLSFNFTFDTNYVVANSVSINFDSCWIGNGTNNLLSNVSKTRSGAQFEIGVVRSDGQNISGFGKIAKFKMSLKSGYAGRIGLSIKNALTTDNNNNVVMLKSDTSISLPIKLPELLVRYATESDSIFKNTVNRQFSGSKPFAIVVTEAILGKPIRNLEVIFSVPASGASAIFLDSSLQKIIKTDDYGKASVYLEFSNKIAGNYILKAQLVGQNKFIDFKITNLPDSYQYPKIIDGNDQDAIVNAAFAKPLTIKVTDSYDNSIAGAEVRFYSYPSNNLSPNALWVDNPTLKEISVLTDSNGIANIKIKANQYFGVYNHVSALAKNSSVSFNLSNIDTTNNPTKMINIGASYFTAGLNTNYDSILRIQLLDKTGRVSSGRTVTVAFPALKKGNPSSIYDNRDTNILKIRTDYQGVAVIDPYKLNANDIVGSFFVKANYDDKLFQEFEFSNVPYNVLYANYKFSGIEGNGQTTTLNKVFATPLKLTLEEFQRPLANAEVVFEFLSSDTTVANGYWENKTRGIKRLRTDANGNVQISVFANSKSGSFKINATCRLPKNRLLQTFTLNNAFNVNTNDITTSNSWQLFPNPSSDFITINNINPLTLLKYCKVYNSAGILRGSFSNTENQQIFTIDVSSFSYGLYLLEIEAENKKVYKKFTIQK